MAVTVSFNGTRVNASDTSTNWGNFNSGGGSPAAESPIAYQNALAVNKKINTTAGREGIEYDPGSGALNMTAAANRLWFLKGIIADSFDLSTTWGIEAVIGSGSGAYYSYNMAGSGANNPAYTTYRPQGGYLITAIDPNIAGWREATTGSPALTAVDYFAFAAEFIVGAAKAENLALDAIDIGTGLTLTGGTPDGTFLSFVAWDQDITTNRYGVVIGAGDAVRAIGLLTIGSATATDFTDTDSVVTFPDGYHSAGLLGVLCDIQNASTAIQADSLLISEGTVQTLAADDTRADFTVSGTSGSFDCAATMRNFRNITFTSVCDVANANLECELLTQASANISDSIINTNAQTSIACLQDPTFGTTTDLHHVDFIQTGVGHALEIDTAGDYTFTNLTFTGYGATTSDAAAIDVTAATGTVNITVSGGDSPTYKTAGATVNIIAGAVTLTATAVTTAGVPIQSARVLLRASNGTGPFPFDATVTIVNSGTTATVTHTAHGMATNDYVQITGGTLSANRGVFQIIVTGVNTYTYTMISTPGASPTGTIKSNFVALYGLTDVNGEISTSRVYASAQPVTGWTRKSTTTPLYKEGILTGTVSATLGFNATAVMVSDE